MKTNRRTIIAAGAAATVTVAAGGTWWFTREAEAPKGASDRVDLLAGAYTEPAHASMPESFVMLGLTGGMPNNTRMELKFYDLEAEVLPVPGDLSATLQNLITGEETDDISFTQEGEGVVLEQDAIATEGWWQLRITASGKESSWTFLMPDPNLTGFDTPSVIEAEPDAQSMLKTSLDVLRQHTSLRWWEWLSGGNGAIILADFAVTTPESNGLPPSFESNSLLAGVIPQDGAPTNFRAEPSRSVTIGEEGQRTIGSATPEAIPPIRYLPIKEYNTTYEGHDGEHLGIMGQINGRDCQLVSFHLPGQIEAWFAFWIDVETHDLLELFMLSVNHYMHWVYDDLDEPFELSF